MIAGKHRAEWWQSSPLIHDWMLGFVRHFPSSGTVSMLYKENIE